LGNFSQEIIPITYNNSRHSEIISLETDQSQTKNYDYQQLNSEETEQILEFFSLKDEPEKQEQDSQDQDHDLDSKLQDLLANLLLSDSEKQIKKLQESINKIEYKLHDPEELIQLLLPLIAELLSLKVEESREEVITAIVPIIDQVLNQRINQDKEAMITAISSIIPEQFPDKLANLLKKLSMQLPQLWVKQLKNKLSSKETQW
jgi:hypothetical protein